MTSPTFRELFGRAAEGTWLAPGRVNLIGEHTDHNAGLALPIAIDRGCRVTAARRDDGVVRCRSRQFPDGADVPLRSRPVAAGWSSYVAGVAWVLADAGLAIGGVDILVDSDVPAGAGLSSSAALQCATAVALRDLFALQLDPMAVVRAAHRAETDIVGAPVGLLDQMASMLCVDGSALLVDFSDLSSRHVPLATDAMDVSLLVFDTRITHAHSTGDYAERRRECEDVAARLGVRTLRDVTVDDLAVAALPEPLLRRARHVLSDNARVLDVVAAFEERDAAAAGAALTAGHRSLRDDFEVSVPALDLIVDSAVDAGAWGARLTGGGFGGSALALVPRPRRDDVVAAVASAAAAGGFPVPQVLQVRPSGGARRIG